MKKTEGQLNEFDSKYQEKRIQIISDVKQLNDKLQHARELKKRYEQKGIDEIERRVNARESIAREKAGQEEQLRTLTDRFTHIRQKYALLEEQEKTRFDAFKNAKETEIVGLHQQLYAKKEELRLRREQLISEIRTQEEEKVDSARNKIDQKKEELSRLAIRKVEIGHRPFYEEEMKGCKEEQAALQKEIGNNNLQKETCNRRIKGISREWELEGQAVEREILSLQKDVSCRIADTPDPRRGRT